MALCVAAFAGRVAMAADYVWMEGEQPSKTNFKVAGSAWGTKEYLSEESWLNVQIQPDQIEKQVPEEGIILSYDFQAPSAGSYQVWNRTGYESVRCTFDWRMDNGEWQTIDPQQLTTDLMVIQAWNEVAWLQMGNAQLSAGKHTLQIRLPRTYKEVNGKKEPQRVLYASDAFCIYKGEFRPNGKVKPGEAWQTDKDKQAAAQVYDVSSKAAPGERIVTPLDGLWQVARYDEQDIQDRLGPIASLPPADQLYWMAISVPGDRDVRAPGDGLLPPLLLPHAHRRARRPEGPLLLPALPVHEHDRHRVRQRRAVRLEQGAAGRLGLRHHEGRQARPGRMTSGSASRTRITPSPGTRATASTCPTP